MMGSSEFNQKVSSRLRRRRQLMGLTMAGLGALVGTSFQQIQKYEGGNCSIPAFRLVRLCDALNVPITYFFDLDAQPVICAGCGDFMATI